LIALAISLSVSALAGLASFSSQKSSDAITPESQHQATTDVTTLPPPALKGPVSLEEVLVGRRSIRSYSDADISSSELSQLLWAAQGVTSSQGFRTAPSAGALYPLEIYAVNATGVYHYNPVNHSVTRTAPANAQEKLFQVALNQNAVKQAPSKLVIMGVYGRVAVKYGDRAERYVHLEAGHAAQKVLLECSSLGLGAVPVGAFDDALVREAIRVPADYQPLYIIPIGHVS
jgi:SagB-type dehydrogenase family enzyme